MLVTCCSHCGHLNVFRKEPPHNKPGLADVTCRRAACRRKYRDVPFAHSHGHDAFSDYAPAAVVS